MTIATLEEKFVHDLRDIYDAEHRFLEAQQEMQRHAHAKSLKSMIKEHIDQTEQHIRNLEQVHTLIDQKPRRLKCDAAAGLVSEGEKGLKEVDPGTAMADCLIAGAAAKVEHYEIASYRGLIMLCEQLEYADAAKVLNKNLQEEQMTAKKLEQSMPELLADAMPTAKKSR